MRIIKKEPSPKVAKQIICKNCGATIEYVPADVHNLWSSIDMGGGPDGADGFNCPNCKHQIITRRW